MKNLTAQAVYTADIYLRLSDDDGDKPESNSIKNQREFITEFLKSMPEIRIHAERKDDGFSGVDFFRPGIQEVLQDVRSGAVNCVVVKDLSRLGRNYIETGKVLQEFADHGVRFIAINDGYDTANAQGQASTILLPIKNLMNDSYSRDISVKIRSHLEVKKRKGQFVGAFAAYGYLKSPDDKNQLVVDDYAAEVVRDIFRWKLEGMSQQGIADRLNADGVLSPSEYKRSLGMKYISGFKSNPQAKWSAVAVGRILKNPLYIGVMVQGKTGRPNYKIKKLMEKPEDEWIRVPGAHEPIISEALLTDAVRDCIHAHMETVLNIEKTLQFIAALPAEDTEARKIDRQLEKLKADYEQAMRFKMSAYEKFVDHLLNEDEFKQYQRIYTEKCEAIAAAISKRQEELDAIVRAGSPQGEWIAHFKSFRHVDVMERKILVKIIDRISVYEGNRIEIIFKYQNEYRAAAAYIEQYMECQAPQAAPTVKEAV